MSCEPHATGGPSSRTVNVLFLCTGNSARSILAEAILNDVGKDRFRAFSAGSRPRGEVHPAAIDLLTAEGFNLAGLRSKSWDEFAAPGAPAMDLVVTVCDSAAGETCPVWPGAPLRTNWSLPDPAAATGESQDAAFADAYRMLATRIAAFVGMATPLDSPEAKVQLDALGHLLPESPER